MIALHQGQVASLEFRIHAAKRLCEFRVQSWTCLLEGLYPKPNLFRPQGRGLYLNSEYMRTSTCGQVLCLFVCLRVHAATSLAFVNSEFRWSSCD